MLVGMMGSGKTSLAKSLALKLGMGVFDFDAWIEHKASKSIARIFSEDGEQRFRELEMKTIEFVQTIKNQVISLGGGTISSPDDWDKLKHLGASIWIDTPVAQLTQSLMADVQSLQARPLLADVCKIESKEQQKKALQDRLATILEQRRAVYRGADHHFVPYEKSLRLNTLHLVGLLSHSQDSHVASDGIDENQASSEE